jgi:hypothetical protein
MDHELTQGEVESLLPAYALDAVDDEERAAIEVHLAEHADARAEAAELQRAASLLGHAGGPAPRAVWERLEAAIATTRPADREAPPIPISRAGRRSWSTRTVAWVAAAAAVVVLAVVAVVAIATPASRHPADAQVALARAAQAANDTPGARHAALKDDAGRTVATAVVLPDGSGYLTGSLPELGAGRTYQLWALGDHAAISLGVMGAHPASVVAFRAADAPRGLAITDEVRGGVVQSDQKPAAAGSFPA